VSGRCGVRLSTLVDAIEDGDVEWSQLMEEGMAGEFNAEIRPWEIKTWQEAVRYEQ
jgi:hypothetical protein